MITFGYDCPHCGKKDVAFEVGGFVQRKVKSVPFDVYSILATCNYCGHGIVASLGFNEKNPADLIAIDAFRKHADWREKDSLFDLLDFDPEWLPKPPKPEVPAHLPNNIAEQLTGAEQLFLQARGDRLMIAYSGLGFRKTLEFALKLLDDNTDKNLNWRINALVKNGLLVKSMGDFAHRIRALGNDATHDDISLDELQELRLFTQLFLQYTFTLPAMIPDIDILPTLKDGDSY
ncbi:DUF4145 domain-containing protein [Lonepinella koalarum]|uniref:DUF4145 domain-containing protein n=1 Tax=Lonepinella koalarum TaxID=53417 RepID=UPI003F6DEA41